MNRALAAGVCVAALCCACGERAPRYTLQQVMFQVDFFDKNIESALAAEGGAAEALRRAEELALWTRDPAFDEYVEKRLKGDPRSFAARRAEFDRGVEDLVTALRAGELAAAREVHGRLRAQCDACHAEFRPELLLKAR